MLTELKHQVEGGLVPGVLPADLDQVNKILLVE